MDAYNSWADFVRAVEHKLGAPYYKRFKPLSKDELEWLAETDRKIFCDRHNIKTL